MSRRNAVFDTVQFKQDIIKNLPKYERLEKFLTKNADSLIAHSGNDRYASVYKYYNSESWGPRHFSNVPRSILPEMKLILNDIGAVNLTGFIVGKDGSVSIGVYSQDVEVTRDSLEYLAIVSIWHSLAWRENKRIESTGEDLISDQGVLRADTSLKKSVVYHIRVECDSR